MYFCLKINFILSENIIICFKRLLDAGIFLKATLSKPLAGAPEGLKNLYLRPVLLKKGPHIAFNFRYATRDEVKNYTLSEAAIRLQEWFAGTFRHATLFSMEGEFQWDVQKNGETRFRQNSTARPATPPATSHDKTKHRLLDPAAPWLHALQITSATGAVLPAAQNKWRQINKYIEIIDSILDEKPLPEDAHIADMGSGKGYLTFALYDYLTRHRAWSPRIEGIELRTHLVEFCNKVALDNGFTGLHFSAHDIAGYTPQRLDMLIALHACDTATDLALAAGIAQKAAIIVAAPCCHKQIRAQIHAQNELAPLLKYGILEERQAELVTDGIRALLLEAYNYKTKVFEFVSTEHTAKNVMITATARPRPDANKSGKAFEQVEALKKGFGITRHYLENLLPEPPFISNGAASQKNVHPERAANAQPLAKE